jgi:altronate hydrolase
MPHANPPLASDPAVIRLGQQDNVIVAIRTLEPGMPVEGVSARERVPRGHKVATALIASGQPVIKFGQVIGFATSDIAPGQHVHTQNCVFSSFRREYNLDGVPDLDLLPESQRATFMGYHRANGRVGTRNYIAILTSVNCSATVARLVAEAANRSGMLDAFPNVDGVIALVHGTGCGLADRGEGFELLKRTQWGYATNPNVGGVLLIGLGCEVFQLPRLKEEYGVEEGPLFRTMTIQDTGGTRATIAAALDRIREMLPLVNAVSRAPAPASELVLALQCGGSDGYSGITANPALGVASDLLVRHGGTAILSETPEIYGAEHLLINRAIRPDIGEKLISIIRWWERYTEKHEGSLDNNPSPGNKAGGLTTILEKSLGAAMKGGTTPLRGVFHYAERVSERGFVFMDTPGYDPVSATGQVAGGANIMCFTTGRGSAYGCKPTPSIKIATNSEMYRRMSDDMDINAGDVLEGVSLEAKGQEIFETILKVASGAKSRSEALGYGDAEFVPWQLGATM